MTSRNGSPPACYSVAIDPPVRGTAGWNSLVLERSWAYLEQYLEKNPESAQAAWKDGPLEISARLVSGRFARGGEIRLSIRQPLGPGRTDGEDPPPVRRRALPCPDLSGTCERLVGLDAEMGLMRLHLLAGRTGTGKSTAAEAVAQRFSAASGLPGVLLDVNSRQGSGLVGSFSRELSACFDLAAEEAEDACVFIRLDELEGVGMARSEAQSHQENRAATGTLLQLLDRLDSTRRIAVFATTNLVRSVDQALLRRAFVIPFGLPAAASRRQLISRWTPGGGDWFLDRASMASAGMTPADIDRAGLAASLEAMRRGASLTEAALIRSLRAGRRSADV